MFWLRKQQSKYFRAIFEEKYYEFERVNILLKKKVLKWQLTISAHHLNVRRRNSAFLRRRWPFVVEPEKTVWPDCWGADHRSISGSIRYRIRTSCSISAVKMISESTRSFLWRRCVGQSSLLMLSRSRSRRNRRGSKRSSGKNIKIILLKDNHFFYFNEG